jgi:hypothetical protein
MSPQDDPITANAMHAAQAWLDRIGAPAGAVALVQVAPQASVGVWVPGQANVGMLPSIDDAGAELCEATTSSRGAAVASEADSSPPDSILPCRRYRSKKTC